MIREIIMKLLIMIFLLVQAVGLFAMECSPKKEFFFKNSQGTIYAKNGENFYCIDKYDNKMKIISDNSNIIQIDDFMLVLNKEKEFEVALPFQNTAQYTFERPVNKKDNRKKYLTPRSLSSLTINLRGYSSKEAYKVLRAIEKLGKTHHISIRCQDLTLATLVLKELSQSEHLKKIRLCGAFHNYLVCPIFLAFILNPEIEEIEIEHLNLGFDKGVVTGIFNESKGQVFFYTDNHKVNTVVIFRRKYNHENMFDCDGVKNKEDFWMVAKNGAKYVQSIENLKNSSGKIKADYGFDFVKPFLFAIESLNIPFNDDSLAEFNSFIKSKGKIKIILTKIMLDKLHSEKIDFFQIMKNNPYSKFTFADKIKYTHWGKDNADTLGFSDDMRPLEDLGINKRVLQHLYHVQVIEKNRDISWKNFLDKVKNGYEIFTRLNSTIEMIRAQKIPLQNDDIVSRPKRGVSQVLRTSVKKGSGPVLEEIKIKESLEKCLEELRGWLKNSFNVEHDDFWEPLAWFFQAKAGTDIGINFSWQLERRFVDGGTFRIPDPDGLLFEILRNIGKAHKRVSSHFSTETQDSHYGLKLSESRILPGKEGASSVLFGSVVSQGEKDLFVKFERKDLSITNMKESKEHIGNYLEHRKKERDGTNNAPYSHRESTVMQINKFIEKYINDSNLQKDAVKYGIDYTIKMLRSDDCKNRIDVESRDKLLNILLQYRYLFGNTREKISRLKGLEIILDDLTAHKSPEKQKIAETKEPEKNIIIPIDIPTTTNETKMPDCSSFLDFSALDETAVVDYSQYINIDFDNQK